MKTTTSFWLVLVLSFLFSGTITSADSNIIPKPAKTVLRSGNFVFNNKTKFVFEDTSLSPSVNIILNEISKEFEISPKTIASTKSIENIVKLEIVEGFDPEAYSLDIQNKNIICKASSEAGIFYALQSLIQVMQKENGKILAPCMLIEDKPLYLWRGYMLDISRHFYGKETVKQYLDIMARLKLNRFHWHLTDEQAWRIEIRKYPKLTEIGSSGSWSDGNAPKAFYTQDDIKEIVAYAAERHIMVIPEIDMPGHAGAVSRSYPEISGGGTGRWKGFTFHPAKEYTYEFIENIFTEIAELFPAPYIHIGADEVHFGNQSWHTDPIIQEFIKKNYLIDEVGLEHYFVRRVCEIVNGLGKKMIGWDEIINTGVTPKKAVVMWWRHDKPALLSQALEKGFDVIMTPRIPAYFDFVQDTTHKIGRRWGPDFNELQAVYKFPENLKSFIGKRTKQVLGIQANVWTERIADKKRLDFMTFPRLLAIAEDGWTEASNKNYSGFEMRLSVFMQYLKKLGINYFNVFDKESTPEPWGPTKEDVIAEG